MGNKQSSRNFHNTYAIHYHANRRLSVQQKTSFCCLGGKKKRSSSHNRQPYSAGRERVCEYCKIRFPVDKYSEHKNFCEESPHMKVPSELKDNSTCNFCHKSIGGGLCATHAQKLLQDKAISCHFCQEKFPLPIIQKHFEVCSKNPKNISLQKDNKASPAFAFEHRLDKPRVGSVDSPGLCEFCGENFPISIMKKHSNVCSKNPQNRETECIHCGRSYRGEIYKKHVIECENESKKGRNFFIPVYVSDSNRFTDPIDISEPCDYCGIKFPASIKQKHLQVCSHVSGTQRVGNRLVIDSMNKMISCEFCKEKFPPVIMNKHLKICIKNPGNHEVVCKYCGKKLTEDVYESHAVECEKEAARQDNDCPICLIEIKKDEPVTFLKCVHKFHTECITAWTEKKKKCPLCQTEI